MRFTHFKIENFKGIGNQTLDLRRNSLSNVFTLVGLNESGKTTVLEAINYFIYKLESLNALELDNYEVDDIHNLIPINKRDNFNGKISIQAGVELDDSDIEEIKKVFKRNNIDIVSCGKSITFTQNYFFINSIHNKDANQRLWDYTFEGKVGKSRKVSTIKNAEALLVFDTITNQMPSILYFPNFLFEFPEKIYLESTMESPKHRFYQTIVQDVLDSLSNDTKISEHLIKRIQSEDEKDKRNLTSLLGKMQKQLTEVIFQKWNQIFNKKISKTEIVLVPGKDSKGSYIEFNIKDDVDTYRLTERSLGFRWFFVYILLTQFRSYRKKYNNALFLFDEPASNLHPSAQTELLKSFEKLPKVIYTTHSHYLINPKWLENTFVIKNEAIDYENEEAYNSKNTNIKISRYREFAVKHPHQSNYYQPILEVLDYRPTNLELVPNVIITEGKNDFYSLNYYQETIKENTNPLKIVPGTSSSNLETLISLYLGWGRKFLILLDSDKEGKKQKKRYEEIYGKSITDLIFTFLDIDIKWDSKIMEDLFENSDKLVIQNMIYPLETKYSKKLFNLSIQELYMVSKKVQLSQKTKENFETVILFLSEKLK